MLQNKRYALALDRYDELLMQLPEEEKELRGKVLHNMGVVNAKLFLFERARDYFDEAYRVSANPQSLLQSLMARRMQERDKDYLDYIAKHPDLHEKSLQVERMMEQAAGRFEMTQDSRMLFTLRVCKDDSSGMGNVVPYYDEIEKITNMLKDAYRESVAR